MRKVLGAFGLLAFVVFSVVGMGVLKRFIDERSVDPFEAKMNEGRKYMEYFDNEIPLNLKDVRIARMQARNAYAAFDAAKQYGDPGWELKNAEQKCNDWAEAEQNLSEQIEEAIAPYKKAEINFSKTMDKVRNRK